MLSIWSASNRRRMDKAVIIRVARFCANFLMAPDPSGEDLNSQACLMQKCRRCRQIACGNLRLAFLQEKCKLVKMDEDDGSDSFCGA